MIADQIHLLASSPGRWSAWDSLRPGVQLTGTTEAEAIVEAASQSRAWPGSSGPNLHS